MRVLAELLQAYPYVVPLTTRWADNDVYGHVNNVTYFAYFDTAVNRLLIHHGGLDIARGEVVGLVVESQCHFLAPIAYPESVRVGVRIDKLGDRAVTYGVALFRETGDTALAQGHVVHVFVDRDTRKAVPIPAALRATLKQHTAPPK